MTSHPGPYQVVRPTSGLAVASLVFGILGAVGGWCMFGIPCLVAIGCGHLARKETRDGAVAGDGMAIAGLILGWLFVVPWVLGTIFFGIGVLTNPPS